MRLEYRSDSSQKFWEPRINGNILEVHFGKIGTDGQTHVKEFSSPEEARIEYNNLVCQKLAKGYKPAPGEAKFLKRGLAVQNPSAIGTLCVGQNATGEVLQDVCDWATTCIQYGMSADQFTDIWLKLMEDGNNELTQSLGRYTGEIEDLESPYWEDNIQCHGDDGDFNNLYAKAVKENGDWFGWVKDKDGYYYLIALRGDFDLKKVKVSSKKYRRQAQEIGHQGPSDYSRVFEDALVP